MSETDNGHLPGELLGRSINELNLHFKTHGALKNARIETVGAIIETERGKGLLRVRNLGKTQYQNLQTVFQELGLTLDGTALSSDGAVAESEVSNIPAMPPQAFVSATPVMAAPEPPVPAPPDRILPRTAAFIDYEHWFISLREIHGRRPNIQAWFDDIRKRGRLLEVTFFGDFSDTGGMRDEINHIRRYTNRIIETKNINVHKKNFTDFIMLDNIYQKVIASPEVEQIVLFTGDGDFSSVASYLRNFCGKTVGVYGVDNAISSQLEAISDWCVRLPFANEPYQECRLAILKNLKYAEAHSKAPMFRATVRLVAEHYDLPEDTVEAELRLLIQEGIVYSVPERSRRDFKVMLNILRVHWDMVADLDI